MRSQLEKFAPALLFCPADRPERYASAASRADAAIIDLEDAVAPDRKAFARESLRASGLDPQTTIVRINPVNTEHFGLDLRALSDTGYRTVMLAKVEHAFQLDALAGYNVIGICETVLGVENSRQIAAASNVIGLMWGAEDLTASLGGSSSRGPDGHYREVIRYARARVLFAASAEGKGAIDAVHLDIADTDGLSAEAADASAVGFVATACIHPSQVATVRTAYAPTAEEVRWATALLEEALGGPAVFRFEGRMVDEPVLRQARRILEKSAHD